ncbi:hypothetical protein F3Y22_tig00110057pilonHSYRG00233 [Hibiscus syriacus]|uniref:YTH domain-containing family protein n=1 Tax=Hibiscus syriacus TaxID=106335 RepID=A0A6A3BMV8_HIBSY|nr:hypothetical protein F3Y22_tig00110057pilonHSYRG00233 [Hibiscus syriacus]
MSSNTARENASVVDSSVTEWKNDLRNSDDLENEDGYPIRSQELEHSKLSIKKGIWATLVMNETILEEAFHNSGSVILIFSVNMSGFFQGYAQMISSVGWRRDNVWRQGSGKGDDTISDGTRGDKWKAWRLFKLGFGNWPWPFSQEEA